MEMIHIAPGGDYARYEELTLKKDQYEKEADLYQLAYIREFGELITESFQLKIECIALKKEIAIYVKAQNAGQTITPEEVKAYLKKHMAGYNEELKRMIEQKNASKTSRLISESEAAKVKSKYRKLAKLLHPDISPIIGQYPQFGELFNRITLAYKCNDLKELEKLEVLVNKALEENGVEGFDVVIPNIEERIEEIEAEIDAIIHSLPYTYKKLLEDKEAIEEKKAELTADIHEYTQYKKELNEKLSAIKGSESNGKQRTGDQE